MFENKRKISKLLLRACKLSVGSSLAIYIARFLNLEYATTAGTIALLTIATISNILKCDICSARFCIAFRKK